jgi:F1F0 ATPase subunit 2
MTGNYDWLWLVFALVVGATLGVFYFGGLWYTVLRLPDARNPVMLTFLSYLGRMAVLLVGFYLVSGGSWQRLLASLVGFLVARQVMIRRYRPDLPSEN